MNIQTETTYAVSIYIAGDVNEVKNCCAHWCYRVGKCVTVTETEYIYTGGRERGAIVGLVNYPRFPDSREGIWKLSEELASILIRKLAQHSVLIQDDKDSKWITRRHT